MPAPRKPSNVLALHGSFDKNPDRARDRAGEPIPPTLVDVSTMPVPDALTELEAVVWRRVAKTMHARVVADTDVISLITYVRLATRVLYDPQIDLKVANAIRPYIAMFGLSPADRSRVQQAPAPPGKEADPMAEFGT